MTVFIIKIMMEGVFIKDNLFNIVTFNMLIKHYTKYIQKNDNINC